ncbi:hypothetical protein DUNSADRAFT_17073 [Dunaliella salina]|uniref:Threonine/Serine exporter ThrE domain-containing protein n=1 Tax=Dunaliella salina TaxID=3046 RepID=A0ABQ7G2H0_DUNSA|nr:hypothetical protein DUNSADRAFT_17073 [Dunaliella salina]|eukprot:KAF5828794.1 hypothetical protein DUNSADRAFT_17073 [Dunaliella salina]
MLSGALSTCSVELGPYVLGSWIGMLPGTYAYVNAGVAGRAVVMEGGEGGMSLDPVQIGLALVTSAVAVAFIGQTAKKAIEDMEQEDEQERQKEQKQ